MLYSGKWGAVTGLVTIHPKSLDIDFFLNMRILRYLVSYFHCYEVVPYDFYWPVLPGRTLFYLFVIYNNVCLFFQ